MNNQYKFYGRTLANMFPPWIWKINQHMKFQLNTFYKHHQCVYEWIMKHVAVHGTKTDEFFHEKNGQKHTEARMPSMDSEMSQKPGGFAGKQQAQELAVWLGNAATNGVLENIKLEDLDAKFRRSGVWMTSLAGFLIFVLWSTSLDLILDFQKSHLEKISQFIPFNDGLIVEKKPNQPWWFNTHDLVVENSGQ